MPKHAPSILLVLALAGSLAFALSRSEPPPLTPSTTATSTSTEAVVPPSPPLLAREAPPLPEGTDTDPSTLPPGHPPIGGGSPFDAILGPSTARASNDLAAAASLTWTAPASFLVAPNPSTMRLATYAIPRAAGDADATELSVVQAGGSTDANIERWLGQFDDAGKETRVVQQIAGMKVTVVEVHGTFQGGGMAMGAAAMNAKGPAPQAHTKWALLAAIVEAPGSPYFFKMVGPQKSVAAARAPFDALVASITPAKATAAHEGL